MNARPTFPLVAHVALARTLEATAHRPYREETPMPKEPTRAEAEELCRAAAVYHHAAVARDKAQEALTRAARPFWQGIMHGRRIVDPAGTVWVVQSVPPPSSRESEVIAHPDSTAISLVSTAAFAVSMMPPSAAAGDDAACPTPAEESPPHEQPQAQTGADQKAPWYPPGARAAAE